MGIGTITAEEVFSERVELQPRTSDPSNTEEGEAWIRSDIAPKSNQIATFRVDTGGSTIDVPILQTGTSQDGVVEALRVSVGSTMGYVPAIPESKAAFPALRLQHNGQVYGWHDARGETAFFDVGIDSTNAPVVEGKTLTVDYSVQNTGGSLDNTQDIRLEVGSTERDRDSGVTLASGNSTTGQLSWGSAAQGSYTASVVSDDDIASTSVNVEGAIPDSAVFQVNAQNLTGFSDGDGVSTWTDEVNSNDATATGSPVYRDSAINGNPAVELDGVDDYFTSDVSQAQPLTVFVVMNLLDTSSDTNIISSSNNTAVLNYANPDFGVFAGSAISGTDDTTDQLFGAVLDGSNSELRQDGSQTASGNAGTKNLNDLTIGRRESEDDIYTNAQIGFVELHNGTPSNGLQTREQGIADMWGITV